MSLYIQILDGNHKPVDKHYVNDRDEQLLIEALYCLRGQKEEALRVLTSARVFTNHPPFTEADFGIPRIDALLKIVEGE